MRRGHRRRNAPRQRHPDVRRIVLQSRVRPLRADARAHLRAAERVPSDRRALPNRQRLLRRAGHADRRCQQRCALREAEFERSGRPVRQRKQMLAGRRDMPPRDELVQCNRSLLRRHRSNASLSLQARHCRHPALHDHRRLPGCGLAPRPTVRVERRLLRAGVLSESERWRRGCAIRVRRLVRLAVRRLHDDGRLLPGHRVRPSARQLERNVRHDVRHDRWRNHLRWRDDLGRWNHGRQWHADRCGRVHVLRTNLLGVGRVLRWRAVHERALRLPDPVERQRRGTSVKRYLDLCVVTVRRTSCCSRHRPSSDT